MRINSTSKLTVVIPFLNEGEEVTNTLESIIRHSNGDVEIILVNDSSDDHYDYKAIAEKYNTRYIVNKERKGPAASREIGIQEVQTPCFLLLDAHMRFHDSEWVDAITYELNKSPNCLICCQTSGFKVVDGRDVERPFCKATYGTRIIFDIDNAILEHEWLSDLNDNNVIPCVLGAAYACNKKYWQHIKGLTGLKQWGSDEPYISMKVWLEGGVCKILPNITISHLYREETPYSAMPQYVIYNKLFVAETLLPESIYKRYRSFYRSHVGELYNDVILLLHEQLELIEQLKTYYAGIFTRTFYDMLKINNLQHPQPEVDSVLSPIISIIDENRDTVKGNALVNGKLGLSIFYFHLSRFWGSKEYELIAEELLDEVMSYPYFESDFIQDGTIGLGWAICYLYGNRFIDGDLDKSLKEIDDKVERIILKTDLSRGKNEILFADILIYLSCRASCTKKNSVVSESAMMLLQEMIHMYDNHLHSISPYLLDSLLFFKSNEGMSIYDIFHMHSIKGIELNYDVKHPLGLNGYAGHALRIILDRQLNI